MLILLEDFTYRNLGDIKYAAASVTVHGDIRNSMVYMLWITAYERDVFQQVDTLSSVALRDTLLRKPAAQLAAVAHTSFGIPWQTASNTTTSLGIDDEV